MGTPTVSHESPARPLQERLTRLGERALRPVDALDPTPHAPAWLARRKRALAVALSITVPLGVLVRELWLVRVHDEHRFDSLLFSGALTTITALWLARGQGERFAVVARRLADRKALVVRTGARPRPLLGADVDLLVAEVTDRGRLFSHRSRVAVGAGMAVALVLVGVVREGPVDVPLLLLSVGFATPLGYLAGRALGSLAAYGWVRSPLVADGREPVARPGHPDRAAGLRPLGEFYFSQALLLAIPGVFLAAWLVLLETAWFGATYDDWIPWYRGFLAAVILLQIALFVLPMWKTDVAMQRQRDEKWSREADALGARIARVRKRLRGALAADERDRLNEQLTALTERYAELEYMPTWPVDSSLRRRFTLESVAFTLPIAADATRAALGL